MRFMRATGNLVLISMLRGLGFLYVGAMGAACAILEGNVLVVEEEEGSCFMRGPRDDIVGEGM